MIRCDCGYEATGADDDDLVAQAQAHARQVHGTDVSAEVVLRLTQTPRRAPTALPEEG